MENEFKSTPTRPSENKGDAKIKIILFVIGVLVGAVISTAAFFVYTTTLGSNNSSTSQMPGGTPPEMPSGQNGQSSQGGTPPEMPSGNNSSSNNNAKTTTDSDNES